MSLEKPGAILFDFGSTLCTEPPFDPLAGTRALLDIAADRGRASPEELQAEVNRLVAEVFPAPVDRLIEIPCSAITRLVYERFGVVFDRPDADLDELFEENAYIGAWRAEPGVSELLDAAREAGIPTAVLSNNGFRGPLVRKRIEEAGIRHDFRFILSTADYAIRKPHPEVFLTAAGKLGLAPERIWYCGDNPPFDVAGSRAAGMIAVLYDPRGEHEDGEAHLRIRHWSELADLLG
jgi:putative hydrolase of the HAD superfamily